MRIGLSVPQLSQLADRDTITTVATRAEAAGYDSLWAMDRLLAALQPSDPYPGTPDGALPAEHHHVLDPLGVLFHASAVTDRLRLGTNVLVAPWYRPVLLARSLTTLDHLSGGRLTAGFGVGWSTDEYQAAGATRRKIGAQLDETLDVLEAVWADEVVEHDGEVCRIVPATIEPKPVQRPRPPILLAAFTPDGLARIARRADGWLPTGLPHDALAGMWAGLRDMTAGAGRDPDSLELVVRANTCLTDTPVDGDRPVFVGSLDQIAEDVAATAAVGAHELIIDIHVGTKDAGEALDLAAAITSAAGCVPTAA